MSDDIFEQVKKLLRTNEHLFTKLHSVGEAYRSIDFDESGLYEEEEATVHRHWSKLANKLIEALNTELEGCSVYLLEHSEPDKFQISLEIRPQEEELCRLNVNYSVEGEIAIERSTL